MMRPWQTLAPHERQTMQAAVAFLNSRLTEQATIDWALKLTGEQRIEKLAVEELISNPYQRDVPEPWATAWRLIEESWSSPAIGRDDGTAAYGIQARLKNGDRSGAVIREIVKLVAPRLHVESLSQWHRERKNGRKPKSFHDILSVRVTSGELVQLDLIGLDKIDDLHFLTSLAKELDSALRHGLDLGNRIFSEDRHWIYLLGGLSRVYYTYTVRDQSREAEEPDAYHRGLAPSVKLLHAVVTRISELKLKAAHGFVGQWKLEGGEVYLRLWAAMSRDGRLTSPDEVRDFLLSVDDRAFWDLNVFPEVSELRAVRFNDLDGQAQSALIARVRKGPPRSFWPARSDRSKIDAAKRYSIFRELQRIRAAGGLLPAKAAKWIELNQDEFDELKTMRVDSGFPEEAVAALVPRNPDDRYDSLDGVDRLRALQAALGSTRKGWDDDPARRADDWLHQPANALNVLGDFEAAGIGAADYPLVWDRFGWTHAVPTDQTDALSGRDPKRETERTLALLVQLPTLTLSAAIEGLCAWFDHWKAHIVTLPVGLTVWDKLWPIAEQATNSKADAVGENELSVTGSSLDKKHEPMDLDTLNTPAGKLVGVFLAACPSLNSEAIAFAPGSRERQMRDTVISSSGRSRLITQHRLIEHLPYFLRSDPQWARDNLIAPLLRDDAAALALWRAIARRTRFIDVLQIIGNAMAERATDLRLGRETRQSLVFSLIIESLNAKNEGRTPAVAYPRTQQMLRLLDDEVRASAANAIQLFVRDLSREPQSETQGQIPLKVETSVRAAALFRKAVTPFLREVWPQERSLATPGVSAALADLPATAGEAFADAVDEIARFLVPFDCWSMLNYGLYGEQVGQKKLELIDNPEKAEALLRLLDLTVGSSDGAIIPNDLTDALDQIRTVAPRLTETPAFRRLSAAAR